MNRAGVLVAVGAVLLGSTLPALAQSSAPSVSFRGEMRVIGYSWNNIKDFTDTKGTTFKDSDSRYFQRFRVFTTVESPDKKAKVYWALEIGDITWGNGGGANGCEYGGPPQTAPGATSVCPAAGGASARVGNNSGGGLGADGLNVETKSLYMQFDIPGLPGANLLVGIHNIGFLSSPTGAFMDDDAAGIQFNWKGDPADLQLYTAKISENNVQDADDNDMYVGRLGLNLKKDTRVTVEGMIINTPCFARRPVATTTGTPVVSTTPGIPVVSGTPTTTTASTGPCVSADFGDNFWIGGTVATKIGSVDLYGTVVYGQRALFSATLGRNVEESGFGYQLTARKPVGPVQVTVHHWYTTGDENRIPGLALSGSKSLGPGQDFAPIAATTRLNRDSDKLPLPIAGTSWVGTPFVAEGFFGHQTIGLPDLGQPHYANPTGTWGIGAAALLPFTPALALGGGVAYVGASEDNGIFGDSFFEIDAGALYSFNANLSFQTLATYSIPDAGDNAWSVGFRTRFTF